MKTYIVYVNGEQQTGYVKAASHNAAEKKARAKYPKVESWRVSVAYTEI